MSSKAKPLFISLFFALIPTGVFAEPHALPCDLYLDELISEQDHIYLQYYVDSLRYPQITANKTFVYPENGSDNAKALYLFAKNNLFKYEGKESSNLPEVLELAEQTDEQWIKAEAKLTQGRGLMTQNQFRQAEAYFLEAQEMANAIGYQSLEGRALKWLGNVAYEFTDFTVALNQYHRALEIFEQNEEPLQASMVLNNISTVYMDSKDWQRAEQFNRQSNRLYDSNHFKNTLFEAILLTNASVIDGAMGRKESELKNIRLAYEKAGVAGASYLKIKTLVNMTEVLLRQEHTQLAMETGLECLKFSQQNGTESQIAHCQDILAEVFLVENELKAATSYIQLALKQFEEDKETIAIIEALKTLSRIQQHSGDLKSALQTYQTASQLEQKYLTESFNSDVAIVRGRLDEKLASQELMLLEAQNALQLTQLEAQKLREWAYMLAVTLFSFLAYLLWRKLKASQRLQQALTQQNVQLETQSMIDPLTRVNNRSYLDKWWQSISNKSDTMNTPKCLAVVDIDHFKQINDTYGHQVGDDVLSKVADMLSCCTRGDDLLLRWGGEEFVLVLNLTCQQAHQTLTRLQEAISRTEIAASDEVVAVTVSIGAVCVSSAHELQQNWEPYLFQADEALYDIKRGGRNGVKVI
ncbi:TPA: diguanylate cyclase [Vibrio vulnificus]|uniref:tetratricopeptide repeat-containing diguanylate cyclase n=2 Tax=Vibrio vulnificus TaxID=672 RepID=UPI001A21CCDF|nr:GGDEF domain-containing protein [Vibrio vulnificus]ELV8591069.1 GGDEF domain-containing protein [Vibrio vulnificus]MCG6285118.1 GGDEF domain-containing protein [Vibrio vulnificus]MCJ0822726.1 GGDEF domain-containing protein [Vibrio vulnificus]HAS6180830.1 diguanylate cyclase [Vibrio vulnificus]HAS6225864.1 diguanylate cyclase [Vibrio vulnificus]